jgi:hypothetical protein
MKDLALCRFFPERESGGVEVADAAVRLKHKTLKSGQPQFLGSPNQGRSVPS